MKTFIPVFLLFSFVACAQVNDSEHMEDVLDFQAEMNQQYADPEDSPMLPEDRENFESLDFYPIDIKYRVEAEFIRTPNEEPFEMKTSTDRLPVYVKYGEAHFTLDGKDCVLSIFQNVELVKKEEYKDYLFLPYTDMTSGDESYGGGRYIDLKAPEGEMIVIDFNKSYNPYCAYNYKYSCPIPPMENRLDVEVRGGVKAFH